MQCDSQTSLVGRLELGRACLLPHAGPLVEFGLTVGQHLGPGNGRPSERSPFGGAKVGYGQGGRHESSFVPLIELAGD